MAGKKISSSTFLIIFFGFFLFMGVITLFFSVSGMMQADDMARWPSTTGSVTGGYVYESYESSGGKNPTWNWHYYPHISYTYDVDGFSYQSDHIWIGDIGSTDSSWAHGVVNSYPAGSMMLVYYNPSNPSQAVLSKEGFANPMIALTISAIFIAVGAGGMAYALRGRKKAVADERPPYGGTPSTGYPTTYHMHIQESWTSSGDISTVKDEPVLWEGRPKRKAFLLIFPEQTIMASVAFIVFAFMFFIIGLMIGVIPILVIAIVFLAIGTVGMSLRIRSSASRYPDVRYLLTTRHIVLEGGRYKPVNLRADGVNKLQDILAARGQKSPTRYVSLQNLVDPQVRVTVGQRLLGVGSIYANGEAWPLLECVEEPETVLKHIQEAAWKAARSEPYANASIAPDQSGI